MYCYPQVKGNIFGCTWHSNQLELGIFSDMSAYISVLTMTYLKKSISLPLVWVHGHAARETKKTLCVIEWSLYYRHLWCDLEDIQDFGRVPCPLWAHRFLWRSEYVCQHGTQNSQPRTPFPPQIASHFAFQSSSVTQSRSERSNSTATFPTMWQPSAWTWKGAGLIFHTHASFPYHIQRWRFHDQYLRNYRHGRKKRNGVSF